MTRIAYADESGTSAVSKCYAIGVITLEESRHEEFEAAVKELKSRHGIKDELKWHKIRKTHGAINCALDIFHELCTNALLTYDAIIVHKGFYRNWDGNSKQQEMAFYQTYTQLLKHVTARSRETTRVLIDHRVDSYDKQHEVVETIGNHMLNRLESTGRLDSVEKVDSKTIYGIQAADVVTGAFNSACQLAIDPNTKIHNGKLVTISRMASLIGWDDLRYDTMPQEKFNIWHFPTEFRGPTRKLRIGSNVPYVTAEDLS